MLNTILAFAQGRPVLYAVVMSILAVLMFVSAGFIIFVVMKQKGNSDGMEAVTGFSKSSEDREAYYEKNPSERKEYVLKKWTYICSGVLAFCAVVFMILSAIFN